VYRSRDTLPQWFSVFEELGLNLRLLPKNIRLLSKLQPVHSGGLVSKSTNRPLAPAASFDPKTVDNTRTVRSLMVESANMVNSATVSIIPAEHNDLLLSAVTALVVSQDAGCSIPNSDITLQYQPIDVVASTNVAQSSEVLVITADQLQQLGLDASILVSASNYNQPDTTVPHYNGSEMHGSVPVSSHEVQASVAVSQPAMAAVMKSPDLIGQAFASAVGISIDELSSFGDVEPDDNDSVNQSMINWHLTTSTSSQVTDEVTSINNTSVHVSEQSVRASVANSSIPFANSLNDEENRSVLSSDVDMSTLDITMFNSVSLLSPTMPSQPCEDHTNTDSTLATPIKMVYNRNNEPAMPPLTLSEIHTPTSDKIVETWIPTLDRTSPCATGSAVTTVNQCPVSSKDLEVRIFGMSSSFSGSLESSIFTSEVSSGAALSGSTSVSFSNLVPVPSPVHGTSLISSASQQVSGMPGSNDTNPSSLICSASSSLPLPSGPQSMSLPLLPIHQSKQFRIQHARSPSKCVPSILPRSEPELPFSPSKFLCSLPPKTSKANKKAAKAKVSSEALRAIAPKAIITRCYLSPVKQAAASITARAKRLQSSPSRGVWYTAAKLKASESPSCSMTSVVVASPEARVPVVNDDEDEEASSLDGEEQSLTDVDSQLEDEIEEDLSAEQSSALYVNLSLFCLLNLQLAY